MDPQSPATNPMPPASPTPPIAPSPAPSQPQDSNNAPVASTHQAADSKVPTGFSLFKPSLAAIKLNIGTFLALYLLPVLFFLISTFSVLAGRGHSVSSAFLLVLLAGIVLSLLVYPALIVTEIKSVRGEQIKLGEALKSGMKYWGRLVLLWVVLFLGVAIGFVLLIVPGLIFLTRYLLTPYFLVDQNLGVMAAMKASAAATKGHGWAIWSIFGVYLVFGFLNIVPIIGSLIGYALQLMYSCSTVVLYIHLRKPTGAPAANSPVQPVAPTPSAS